MPQRILGVRRPVGTIHGPGAEDLYYRLDVFPIQVPPLRERRDDIPLLASHFRLRFAEEHGIEPPALPAETIGRMMAYDWPKNVRELENFVERSVIMYPDAAAVRFGPEDSGPATLRSGILHRAVDETWDLDRLER